MLQKKKKSLLLVVFCVLFIMSGINGQSFNDSLRIDSVAFYPQCPNLAYEGQNYGNVTVLIKNLRVNTVFTGQLSVYVYSQDTTLGNLPADTLIPLSGTTYTIQPGTSINLFNSGNYDFTPVNYRTGSNVVVVWPVVALGTNTFVDTLFTCVNFVPLNSVGENDINNHVTIFPNPAEDYLTVNLPNQNFIEGVRIYDVSGRLLFSPLWDDTRKIKIGMLSSGIYVLEITTKAKQKIRKQFVRR